MAGVLEQLFRSQKTAMVLVAIREILAEVFGSGYLNVDERIRFIWTASQDLGIRFPNSFI